MPSLLTILFENYLYFYLSKFCFFRELGKNLIIPGGTRILDVRGMYILPGMLIIR